MAWQRLFERVRVLFPEIKTDDVDHCRKAILPIHFLSFEVLAWKISHRQFHYPKLQSRNSRRNFRFETEAVRFEANILDYIRAKEFVARLHIGQVQAAQDVAECGKYAIDQVVKGSVHLDTGFFES